MAEKEISNIIKLQIEAGKATPAPPVGPALGSRVLISCNSLKNLMIEQQINQE